MNEKQLIDQFFSDIYVDKTVQLGIGDDAALIDPDSNQQLTVSTDSMVQGQHFLPTSPPYHVGYKLLAVNISDMAAMGSLPKWVTLNLTLPAIDETWLQSFAEGFTACAKQSHVVLIGGDLTRGKELNISAQILGEVPAGAALLRSAAQVNDHIFVTGHVGTAGLALTILNKHEGDHRQLSTLQLNALYQPASRIDVGIELRGLANAAIDVSDGLLHDLQLLCEASRVDAHLDIEQIPVDKEMEILDAITAGDDYELIFTVPEQHVNQITTLAHSHSCPLTHIGKILAGTGQVKLFSSEGEVPIPVNTGFDHFMSVS